MAHGRWLRPSTLSSARARGVLTAAVAATLTGLTVPARAGEIAVAPSPDGRVGAWLAMGPLLLPPPPAKGKKRERQPLRTIDAPITAADGEIEGRLGEQLDGVTKASQRGESPVFTMVSSADGAIDVGAALGHKSGEAFALLSGVLHLDEPLTGAMLLGASDGLRVYADGKEIFTTDLAERERDDEHIVPLHLEAGDHPLLFKLHHRDGPWQVRIRITDDALGAPRGARILLPGTDDADAPALAAKMARIRIESGLAGDGYHPTAIIRFAEGMPFGIDRSVRARAFDKATNKTLWEVSAGQVPAPATGTSEVTVGLPTVARSELETDATSSDSLGIAVDIAGQTVETALGSRRSQSSAIAAADQALTICQTKPPFLDDPAVTRATIEHLRARLVAYSDHAEPDRDALAAESATLESYLVDLSQGRDPLRSHAGIRRFAYLATADGTPQPFGVYVPPSYQPGHDRRYPLVVALHGMNGRPLSMIRWAFGQDDEAHDSDWEDRHPGQVAPVDAFVVAPNGHGNAMYRELGEVDVMHVLEWMTRFFPIDPRRVSITGPSMGGIGTASIAFRYPDRFSAAEPLCGYHSYFIRRDVSGKPIRPWEKLLAAQRSNVMWAENGMFLPLNVWHGTRDLPEQNSGVLIDRYKELHYSIEEQHPDVGHDVWKKAYEDLEGLRWLMKHSSPTHRKYVVFKTDSLRYADDGWVHVRELSRPLDFGEVRARIGGDNDIDVTTRGVGALTLDREQPWISEARPVHCRIDGTSVTFEPGEPITLHHEGTTWEKGFDEPGAGQKRRGLTGPIRDIFYEPLLFVVGTEDEKQTRANQEVAESWSRIRFGVDVHYPIVRDVDLDEEAAATHSLVLIGNARSNRVLRAIESDLPFHVSGDTIIGADQTYRGDELGVAFIYPNPKHRDRYVLVIEGTSPLGTLRSTSLPDLLPDWIVYDRDIAPARGQILLGAATPKGAGLFDSDWSIGPAP